MKWKDINWVGLIVYFVYPTVLIGLIVLFNLKGCDNRFFGNKPDDVDAVTVRVDTLRDTVFVSKPVAVTDTIVRWIARKPILVHDTILMLRDSDELYSLNDSVLIPISSKTYTDDSTYTAWVSGYEAQLDSIRVYRQTIAKTISVTSRKRWSYGIQGGLYVTPRGVQPGIGFGLTYAFPP